MGLFDNLLGKASQAEPANPLSFTPQNENAAILAVLFACVYSDGELSEVETDNLIKALLAKKWFYDGELSEYLKPTMFAFHNGSHNQIIDNSVNLISEKRKATVFALCCEVAFADGRLEAKEQEALEYIATKMQLNGDLARKIIEVLVIKSLDNKYLGD